MKRAFGFVLVGIITVVGCAGSSDESSTSSSTDDLSSKTCKKPTDCHGALPDLCERCSDGTEACAHWSCESDKCVTEICPAPKPQCTTAKQCTGALPELCEICADGTSQCAHHVCTKGACSVETCEANGGVKPVGTQCKKASDCHGALPKLCRLCSDGSEACAHWACDSGNCETVTCD